jgi:HSP20 family protein
MALIRTSNWPTLKGSLLSDFFDDDRFLTSPSFGGKSLPAVNVKETDKAYEVELAAPGFNKTDFNISVDNGVLTVSAESKQETEKKEDNYTRREFGYASFTRAFSLPVNTNEDDIKAKYEEGILRLTVAKKSLPEAASKKPIEIK